MKKLLVASSAIALIAVLLNFLLAPAKDRTAAIGAPGEIAPRTAPHPARELIASADKIAKPTRADIVPKETPGTNSGVTLTVPGLAPIFLASRNDAPWEKTIDALLARTDLTDGLKARTLIQMLPRLPPEALTRAAEDAITRLPDADYMAALRLTLINPQTHGMATSVLFADLMQRPDPISLPILVSIAQDSKHPYSQNARENLQFLLRQDFGNDWARWNEAIRKRLGDAER